jgi:negative regulator of genetic competence, sporulation and motility
MQDPAQSVQILKQMSKDIKETSRFQGNIDENVFFQYEKLRKALKLNELQLEYNSADYLHASVTFEELENVLKFKKGGKTPGQDNINSELYKYAAEEFKLRLLHLLNNMYRENRIPNKWRNAVITAVFKKITYRKLCIN